MEDSQAQKLISALEQAEGFEINKGESTLIGVCKECASSKEILGESPGVL